MSCNKYIAGIDLGTSNCCVGIIKDMRVEIVQTENGDRTVPSVVTFSNNKPIVGLPAVRYRDKGDKNTVYEIKRIIGQPFDSQEVQDEINNWTFKVINQNNYPRVVISEGKSTKCFPPEAISAYLIKHMVDEARRAAGIPINEIVITCPAYFTEKQRRATRDAGEIAGYTVLDVLREPCAAAYAYGFQSKKEGSILVYDLGGGTFDVTILNICHGSFDVIGHTGDNRCGGVDLDRIMYNLILKVAQDEGFDIEKVTSNERTKVRLYAQARKIKEELSSTTCVSLDDFFENLVIYRDQFEEASKEFFARTIAKVTELMTSVNYTPDQINEVVLVGGSSKIPVIINRLSEIFGEKKISKQINPDEAVAMGATLYAYTRNQIRSLVSSSETALPVVSKAMLEKNAKNKNANADEDEDSEDDDNTEFDLESALRNIPNLNTDRVSMAYGIDTSKGFRAIIKQNDLVNKPISQIYRTNFDNQPEFEILIYQCVDEKSNRKSFIGQYIIDDLPLKPKGEVELIITFSISDDMCLSMKAEIAGTGRVIQEVYGKGVITLSDEEKNALRDDVRNGVVSTKLQNNMEFASKIRERGRELSGMISQVESCALNLSWFNNAITVRDECLICEASEDNRDALDQLSLMEEQWITFLRGQFDL